MDLFALAGGIAQGAAALQAETDTGLVINVLLDHRLGRNFLFFLLVIWLVAFKPDQRHVDVAS